jgi:hypothetical protein
MPTKQEEKFQSMLEDHSEKLLHQYENRVDNRVSSIFLYGLIVGLIIAYAGILPYFAGLGSGFIFYKHFTRSSDNISQFIFEFIHKVRGNQDTASQNNTLE